jgi:hypothetical protein
MVAPIQINSAYNLTRICVVNILRVFSELVNSSEYFRHHDVLPSSNITKKKKKKKSAGNVIVEGVCSSYSKKIALSTVQKENDPSYNSI